jgi:glycosyltransferase involved in cell wall biosynthesis
MQIQAFTQMPDKKLIVIGPYEKSKTSEAYADYIKKIKPANVTLITHAGSFDELTNYYANCRGFITTCHQEDFGMTAIEAMSSGKPVIAPNEGGYRETIIHNKTGLLIDNVDENKLVEAIKKIDLELETEPEKYRKACLKQAEQFDVGIFIEKIKKLISSGL